jgi:hypothetical protein
MDNEVKVRLELPIYLWILTTTITNKKLAKFGNLMLHYLPVKLNLRARIRTRRQGMGE